MVRSYNEQYLKLCYSKPVKAYRLITEYLHGIATITNLFESTILIEIAKLYHETYQTLQNTYLYHGFLFKNMQAYKVYYQLYSKSYYTTHLQSLDLIDKIMWQYEIHEQDLAISLLLIKTAKTVLQNINYVDPEPILQYLLSKRTDKIIQERTVRLMYWYKHETDIKALYKQVNPFLTDNDIWFLYMMQPLSDIKQYFETTNTNIKQKSSKKKKSNQTNIIVDIIRELTPYSPLYVRQLFIQWLNTVNVCDKQIHTKHDKVTESIERKQTNINKVTKNIVEKNTSLYCDNTDPKNIFCLP